MLESDIYGFPKNIDSSIGSNYSIKISLKGYEYENNKLKLEEILSENDNKRSKIDFGKNEPPIAIIKDINRFRDNTNLVFPNSRNSVEDFPFWEIHYQEIIIKKKFIMLIMVY